jgi:hypothetical protein
MSDLERTPAGLQMVIPGWKTALIVLLVASATFVALVKFGVLKPTEEGVRAHKRIVRELLHEWQ